MGEGHLSNTQRCQQCSDWSRCNLPPNCHSWFHCLADCVPCRFNLTISPGFESALVSFKGRVPIAFATFDTQENALSAMAQFQDIKFDLDSKIGNYTSCLSASEWQQFLIFVVVFLSSSLVELRLQLAKSNTSSDRTLSVIGGDVGGPAKRGRYDEGPSRPHYDPYAAAPPYVPCTPNFALEPPFCILQHAHSPTPSHSRPSYRPRPAPTSYGSGGTITTLFVANLAMHTTEPEMEALLCAQPGFKRMRFNKSGARAPICFAEYVDVPACNQAMQALSGHVMPGAQGGLRIEFAQKQMGASRPPAGNSGGSGYGGAPPPAASYDPYGQSGGYSGQGGFGSQQAPYGGGQATYGNQNAYGSGYSGASNNQW